MTEVTGIKPTEGPPAINQEIFKKYFPNSILSSIDADKLPPVVKDYLVDQGNVFLEEPEALALYEIDHRADRNKTYFAIQRRKQGREIIYLIDLTEMGNLMGFGSFRGPSQSESADIMGPFVNHTETLVKYRRRGLGLRRLIIMNALSHAMYGLPLQSAKLISLPETKVWNKLVSQGKAVKFKDSSNDTRYTFNFQ